MTSLFHTPVSLRAGRTLIASLAALALLALVPQNAEAAKDCHYSDSGWPDENAQTDRRVLVHSNLGLTVEQDFRIYRNDGSGIFAVYTVGGISDEIKYSSWGPSPIRMTKHARRRLYRDIDWDDIESHIDCSISTNVSTKYVYGEVQGTPVTPVNRKGEIGNEEPIDQGQYRILIHPQLREALGADDGDVVRVWVDDYADRQITGDDSGRYADFTVYDDHDYWKHGKMEEDDEGNEVFVPGWENYPIRLGPVGRQRLMGLDWNGDMGFSVVVETNPLPEVLDRFPADSVYATVSGNIPSPLVGKDLLTTGRYDQEHITLPSEMRKILGLRAPFPDDSQDRIGEIQQQVRVWIDENEDGYLDTTNEPWGIYTVLKQYDWVNASWVDPANPLIPVYMGLNGRERLAKPSECDPLCCTDPEEPNCGDVCEACTPAKDGFEVIIDLNVVAESETCPYEVPSNPFYQQVRECLDNYDPMGPSQTDLVVAAPHGGSVEVGTDEMAMKVYDLLPWATIYRAIQRRDFDPRYKYSGTGDRFHITAAEIDDTVLNASVGAGGEVEYEIDGSHRHVSYPKAAQLAATKYTKAVAFHGFSPDACQDIDGSSHNINDVGEGDQPIVMHIGGQDTDARDALVITLVDRFRAIRNAAEEDDKNDEGDPLYCIDIRAVGDDPDDENAGVHDLNIVNRMTINGNAGLQFETSWGLRNVPANRDVVAEEVANYYAGIFPNN